MSSLSDGEEDSESVIKEKHTEVLNDAVRAALDSQDPSNFQNDVC